MMTHQSAVKKSKVWISTAFGYSLFAVVCTLPFSPALNSISLILLAVCWLAEGSFLTKVQSLRSRPLIWVYLAFYACFVIGMLYTENVPVGQFNLEKKMSLIALPLLIGTSWSFDRKMRDRALWCFVFSSILAAIVSLAGATYMFVRSGDASYFVHDKLTSIIELQAPYFGMFLVFTFIILVNYGVDRKDYLSRSAVLSLSIAILFVASFVVLLSARTATVFVVVYGMVTIFKVSSRRHRRLGAGLGVVAVGLMSLLIANSSYLQDRFIKPLVADISVTGGGEETGLSIRMVKWKCSLEGFMEEPLLGVGTGDAGDYLVGCYKRVNFWGMYESYRFNSHNQYLETALTLGLMGLFAFLGLILLSAKVAFMNRDYLFLSFLALFAFACITESVLERQWGIVFFTLFGSLLSFSSNSIKGAIKP